MRRGYDKDQAAPSHALIRLLSVSGARMEGLAGATTQQRRAKSPRANAGPVRISKCFPSRQPGNFRQE